MTVLFLPCAAMVSASRDHWACLPQQHISWYWAEWDCADMWWLVIRNLIRHCVGSGQPTGRLENWRDATRGAGKGAAEGVSMYHNTRSFEFFWHVLTMQSWNLAACKGMFEGCSPAASILSIRYLPYSRNIEDSKMNQWLGSRLTDITTLKQLWKWMEQLFMQSVVHSSECQSFDLHNEKVDFWWSGWDHPIIQGLCTCNYHCHLLEGALFAAWSRNRSSPLATLWRTPDMQKCGRTRRDCRFTCALT